MRVAEIWTYPVKSMIGHRVEDAELSVLGIAGDRHWAIRDMERGGIRGAKKIGGLMQLTAGPVGDGSRDVVITLPDGRRVSSRDADVNAVLSAALGTPVALESLPADDRPDHFRRGPADSDDMLAELRGIFGREVDEPLPDFSVFPPEVAEFESPVGTHHDCWPLMVMTTSALDALSRALPDSAIDIRRFRPSVVIEGAEPGHPEFSWKGRVASLGGATIEFLDPCPRCVMVTRRIDASLPEDRAILRHIIRDLDQNVGVYARVLEPGSFSVGDALTFHGATH